MTIPAWWKQDVLGADVTSMKVGGKLDYFARPTSMEQLQETFAALREHGLAYKVIGAGSNLLMADAGFRGVVVQPGFTTIQVVQAEELVAWFPDGSQPEPAPVTPRYSPETGEGLLNLQESAETAGGAYAYVAMGAGVPWGQAVTASLRQHASGLQYFARIPCNVGGAIYNNIHGATHLLSETIVAVRAFDPVTQEIVTWKASECGFGYDQSIFHKNGQVIIEGLFQLQEVDAGGAKRELDHYLEWTKEKARVQPSGANCGSVFQNLQGRFVRDHGLPSGSAAWYIDRCGWKGKQQEAFQVYPGHANFIINHGGGSEVAFIQLVEAIRASVYAEYKVELRPEVECIDEVGNPYVWQHLSDLGS